MMKSWRSLQRAEGFALIFAIWAMAILIVIVAAFAWNQMNEVKIAATTIDTIAARYLAEAGVERAIMAIKSDYKNDSRAARAWVSTNHTRGSLWARLGKWDGLEDAAFAYNTTAYLTNNMLTTWPAGTGAGDSLKYYLPSEATAFVNGDAGYYQVAVEDESGKINVNSDPVPPFTAAMKAAHITAGRYGSVAFTDAHYRTINEIGLGGPTYLRTFKERSFLTVYPMGTISGATTKNNYDSSGAINVNSAYYYNGKSPLIGIPLVGGTTITAAMALNISNNRTGDPYHDSDTLKTLGGLPALPLPSAVRFDSVGYYRIISRGIKLAGDGVTELAEANIECYIKATFGSDAEPVQIVYWQEWWAIP